jgi:two-component sensor histidine kinase
MTTSPIAAPGHAPVAAPALASAARVPLLERRLARWAIIAGVWTVLGFLSVSQSVIYFAYTNQPIHMGTLIVARMADWYTCAVFTPAFFWLADRWPIDREHWRIGLPVHLVAAMLFVVLKFALFLQVRLWISPKGGGPTSLRDFLAGYSISEFLIFLAVIGVVHAVQFYRRFRAREIQAERLRTQLAEARLAALSSQLRPHFLFNTLQGISTLMYRDAPAADAMLARLSDLLRRSLTEPNRHEVPLAEELATLEDYVGIMRIRFQDRLVVDTFADPDAAAALVPRFLLQPLVENALEHGIARRAGAGRIEVRAAREGESLVLSVTDDGAGLGPTPGFPPEGIGLGNTRLRLEELYGDAHALTLEPLAAGGLRVRVAIPWREALVPAEAAS